MKWWARIGFFAFLLYYIDEVVALLRTSTGAIDSIVRAGGLLLWFCLVLIPLAYYGFRMK